MLVDSVFYADSEYHMHFARKICSDRKVPGIRAKFVAFCYMLGKLNTFFQNFLQSEILFHLVHPELHGASSW